MLAGEIGFIPATKSMNVSERPKRTKVRSGWWCSTAKVFLIGNNLDLAWPERKLMEATIENVSVPCKGPGRGNLIKACI